MEAAGRQKKRSSVSGGSGGISRRTTLEKGVESEEQDRIAVINSLSSNLPAVLNNPAKGKQRDFFTRTWGEDFNRDPPSNRLPDLPPRAFEKYLRKLRKYRGAASASATPAAGISKLDRNSPDATGGPSSSSSSLSGMPRMFWDPGFRLSHPDTFTQVFPFFTTKSAAIKSDNSSPTHATSSSSKLVQERLARHLDLVEVDIADQVAQKSHHFFEVMTYHDALMTQLVGLNKHVELLRSRLKFVDQNVYKNSMEVCRLERRRRNAKLLADKLAVMSHLHQTQPKIQLLLSGNEFSGALDLITTSRDVLSVDLAGVVSFRHLSSQLSEIQSIIGKMLLGDFQTYISEQIHRAVVHERATVLTSGDQDGSNVGRHGLSPGDTDQLTSVILGLVRQNSFAFLEVLDAASVAAVKNVIREVGAETLGGVSSNSVTSGEHANHTNGPSSNNPFDDVPQPQPAAATLTAMAADFAVTASSKDWTDFFDLLVGSLVSLLRRIAAVHAVILRAIEDVTASDSTSSDVTVVTVTENSTVLLPEQQLKNLQATSHEVLVNVCDQVVERSSKILTQRSKPGASDHITVQELQDISLFTEILNAETHAMTGKNITGFQLSLQGQILLFIQAFHEEKRLELSDQLEKEKWKRSDVDFTSLRDKFDGVNALQDLLFSDHGHKGVESSQVNGGNPFEERETSSSKNSVWVDGEEFAVVSSTQTFLVTLAEYCRLGQRLPSVLHELGLRVAEILKFYNSKICQLVLGVGAISVSGLKTITIRNLALARRSLQLVTRVLPAVRSQFIAAPIKDSLPSVQNTAPANHLDLNSGQPGTAPAQSKNITNPSGLNNNNISSSNSKDSKQFNQAASHLENHVKELDDKILCVVDQILSQQLTTWAYSGNANSKGQQTTPNSLQTHQIPSANFKALTKHLTKLHESVADIWPEADIRKVMVAVHQGFMANVKDKVRERKLAQALAHQATAHEGNKQQKAHNLALLSEARAFKSELTFYSQSLLRLNVVPEEMVSQDYMESVWTVP